MNKIELLVEQRLKVPTVQRKLFEMLKTFVDKKEDLFKKNIVSIVKNLNESEKKNFYYTLIGPTNYKHGRKILESKYENIV